MNDPAYAVGYVIGILAVWGLLIWLYVRICFSIIRTEKHTKAMSEMMKEWFERDKERERMKSYAQQAQRPAILG